MNATTPATSYAAAVAAIADDIVRQLDDGEAPCRRCSTLAAGGYYFEAVRVYFAEVIGDQAHGIPRGVARVALDMERTHGRRFAHEVRVYLDRPAGPCGHAGTTQDAEEIAAAVLDLLNPTADYAR